MAKNRDFSKFPNAITVLDNGNVGIGTTTFSEGTQPTGTLSFIPNSSVSSGPLIQLAGNGRIRPASTSDRLSIDGNALYLNSAIGGDIIMNTAGGKVGIGISNPSFLLSVNSATDIWHLAVGDTSASGKMVRIGGYAGGGAYGVIGAYNGQNNGSPLSLVVQRDGGNFGIGLTNPQQKLHVAGGSDYNTMFSSDSNRAGWVIATPGTFSASASALVLASDGSFRLGNASQYQIAMYTNNEVGIWGGGAERMRVTNGGQVTISSQPSFAAYASSNQEPSSDTILSYNIADVNRGGHYNTSNSRFTAPIAGVYAFGVKVWYKPSTTGTIWVHLRINGSVFTEQRMSIPTATADYTSFFPKWVVGLAAGDYVEVSGYGNGSNFHSSNTARYSQFYGHLLH